MRFSINYLLGLIVIILTGLGVSMDNSYVPNQEILLEYSSSDASNEDLENAIAAVRLKLTEVQARNIKLQYEGQNILKISYFSKEDVSQIKELLSAAELFQLQKTSDKEEDSEKELAYLLDVHSLEQNNDGSLSSTSSTLIENKTEIIRSTQPNDTFDGESTSYGIQFTFCVVNSFTAQRIAVLITKFNTIPESRAGPLV